MDSKITLATAWVVTVAAILLARWLRRHRNPNPPPGPKPWPIIGNLNLIGSLPHRSLHSLSQKYGPIMQLRFGSHLVVVGSSVEMAKSILKTHDLAFAGRPEIAAGKYTTYNYSDITWSQYGPYWRQARKMCLVELFSAKRLESYEYIRKEELKWVMNNLFGSCGNPINLKDFLSDLSLNVISRMVLGKKYTKDMVDVLLQLADDPNLEVKLDRRGVKAFTQDLIAGGTESSAVTVEWAISELLKKPEIFNKATEELDRVVGRDRWVEEKDVANLPYINSIVKETLVPRMAREDVDIGGYKVTKGTRIFVNTWTIGRDPAIWDAPEEFNPERFIGKEIDVKGHDFELLPFGAGRRMCPGYPLGIKVIQVSLANLVHGFKWGLPSGMKKEDLNMEEIYGLSTPKKFPLVAVAQPRLPIHLYAN
ncbi:Cytochrome P450 71AU50 [Linum perenne]